VPKSRLVLVAALSSLAGCHSRPLREPGTNPPSASEAGAPSRASAEATPRLLLDRVHISSDPGAEHHQLASADADFGSEPVAKATLHVTLESPCFPFAGWREQTIPEGQRWPLLCDAFDRALSVSLDDPSAASDAPALELLRAVTPFGGPLELESDVTDVVNGLPGQHRLQLRIDTNADAAGLVSGAKGEWIASVELTLFPGAAPRRVLAVLPLASESQTRVDAEPLSFTVPDGAGSARIEYRVTGHGAVSDVACRGAAEEFCRRTHRLSLDGAPLVELVPWRSDCSSLCSPASYDFGSGSMSYCAENPCGDPNSVRAPRANWCPGSLTEPFVIEGEGLLAAGEHVLGRSIEPLRDGGNWLVSASYFAFE
jgi:hypothetical protein